MNTSCATTWAGQVEHLVYLLVGMPVLRARRGSEPIRWRLAPRRGGCCWRSRWLSTRSPASCCCKAPAGRYAARPTLHVDALSDTRTGGAIMWFGGDAIMAAVMIALVVGWLRHVGHRQGRGQAGSNRHAVATFAAHTGPTATTIRRADLRRRRCGAGELQRVAGSARPELSAQSRSCSRSRTSLRGRAGSTRETRCACRCEITRHLGHVPAMTSAIWSNSRTRTMAMRSTSPATE